MTIPQFSNNLALNFQKIIIVPLINEYIKTIEGNDKSWEFIGVNWKFNLGIKKDKKIILKEWIVFEMFLLRQQISIYFKGNQIGNNIIDPSNADAHYGLGSTYFKIGDKSSALNEYKILRILDINIANELAILFNK